MEKGFALRADAGNHSNRKRIEKLLNHIRHHHREAVRLLMTRSDLGNKLVRTDAKGTAEFLLFSNLGFELCHELYSGRQIPAR
jgi:hypothetical protein